MATTPGRMRRHGRRVVGEDLEVALVAGHDHRLRRPAEQDLVGRHEFEGKGRHG